MQGQKFCWPLRSAEAMGGPPLAGKYCYWPTLKKGLTVLDYVIYLLYVVKRQQTTGNIMSVSVVQKYTW